jgi:hypothetical protein
MATRHEVVFIVTTYGNHQLQAESPEVIYVIDSLGT